MELTDRDAMFESDSIRATMRTDWSNGSGTKSRESRSGRGPMTTMYLRFYLSDLFIHGIGGAKYDELTDEIIRRFFGIEPPRYLTATATIRLPIDRPKRHGGGRAERRAPRARRALSA